MIHTTESIQQFCWVCVGLTGSRTFVYFQKWFMDFFFCPVSCWNRIPFSFWRALGYHGFDILRELQKQTKKTKQKVCAWPSCLCFYGLVVSFTANVLGLPCLLPAHCDCSARARLIKMSFFFLFFTMHNTAIWFRQVERNELQCGEC